MRIKILIVNVRNFLKESISAIRSKNPRVLQPIALFGSMVLDMGLMFISGIITARLLGPANYGDLQFIRTVMSLLTLVVTFGIFYSGSRVLVTEADPQKCHEISGTIVFISFVMGLIVCVAMAALIYPADYFFHTNVGHIVIPLLPFFIGLCLDQALPLILQSTNRIYLLAIYSCAPAFLYILVTVTLSLLKLISTSSVLITFQVTTLLVNLLIVAYTKPSLVSIKYWWEEIKKRNKSYGFPVYRGALIALGTGYLNRLGISYWVNNTAIGFFSLATNLTEPLKFLPNAIATSSFRRFAGETKISRKILLTSIAITLASLVVALVFYGAPLAWLYTSKFIQVSPMARALSVAAIFMGFGDMFNRFLGAHGQGKPIQNAAISFGVANALGIFVFVPYFGVWGAVITSVLAGSVYLLQMYLSYRRFNLKISSQVVKEELNLAEKPNLAEEI